MIVITIITMIIKHYEQNKTDNDIIVLMMQAEPAGISACNAKSIPPDKLVLSGSELLQAICHLRCVMLVVSASSACDCARVWSMQRVPGNRQLHCSCLTHRLAAAQVLHLLPHSNSNASSIACRLLGKLNDLVGKSIPVISIPKCGAKSGMWLLVCAGQTCFLDIVRFRPRDDLQHFLYHTSLCFHKLVTPNTWYHAC